MTTYVCIHTAKYWRLLLPEKTIRCMHACPGLQPDQVSATHVVHHKLPVGCNWLTSSKTLEAAVVVDILGIWLL